MSIQKFPLKYTISISRRGSEKIKLKEKERKKRRVEQKVDRILERRSLFSKKVICHARKWKCQKERTKMEVSERKNKNYEREKLGKIERDRSCIVIMREIRTGICSPHDLIEGFIHKNGRFNRHTHFATSD